MKISRLMLFLFTMAVAGVSCGKRPQPADAGADDAKLRPEAALAKQGASPTPGFGEPQVSPTPSP